MALGLTYKIGVFLSPAPAEMIALPFTTALNLHCVIGYYDILCGKRVPNWKVWEAKKVTVSKSKSHILISQEYFSSQMFFSVGVHARLQWLSDHFTAGLKAANTGAIFYTVRKGGGGKKKMREEGKREGGKDP